MPLSIPPLPRGKDLWRPVLLRLPMVELLRRGHLDGLDPVWLPDSGSFRFLADPFGFHHGGVLHVLAERYDYRDRHGAIELLRLDPAGAVLDRREVLREPWHLSYPITVEQDGERFMLPEAHRSGGLRLYRMDPADPGRWHAEARLLLDAVPVDATPFHHDGLWWLFYSPAEPAPARQSRLHLAWAERLQGPWHPHRRNPVRCCRRSARPGGTPVATADGIVLPVQDCGHTYGGAIRPLLIRELHPDRFDAGAGTRFVPPAALAPFTAGLHTMAACGELTLLDAKRQAPMLPGLVLDVRRLLRDADGRRPAGPDPRYRERVPVRGEMVSRTAVARGSAMRN